MNENGQKNQAYFSNNMQQMPNNYGNMNQSQMQQMPNNYGNMNQPQMQQMPNNYGNMNQSQMQQMANNYGNMNQPQMQQMPNNYGNMNEPQMQQMPNNYGNMNQPQMQQMPNNYQQTTNAGMNYSSQGYGNFDIKKIKNKKVLIIVVAIFVLFIGYCLFHVIFSNGSRHNNGNFDRLIMLYMVGSNLESGDLGIGTLDLNGVDYSSLQNNNTKLIVIAGGAKEWHNNYIDVNSTSIYELTSSGYKIVKKQSIKNMGDFSVLGDFLNYGYNNYGAKKYDLIFWNHGLGAFGYGSDELSGDFLSLSEIDRALKSSKFNEKNKLELVVFRSCLNGTIEVADTLKKYSEYMVASEEITYGYAGNNVLKILNDIKNTDDGGQFGIKFVDSYMDYISYLNSSGSYTYNTYSVIDLSKIDKVETALSTFVKDINLSLNYNLIAKARSSTLQYAFNNDPTYDSVDLYTLVSKLSYLSPDKANEVINYLSEAVVYNKATDSRSKGLSIYFPYNGESDTKKTILNKIYDFDDLKEYKSFIVSFNNIQNSNTTPLNLAESAIDLFYDSSKKQADFQFTLTDEQLKIFDKASFVVFEKEDNENYFPVYYSNGIQIDGNTLKGSIKDRQLKLVGKSETGKSLLTYKFYENDITKLDLDYKDEQQITLIEVENTDDYIMYYTLVSLSNQSVQDSDENLNITGGKMYLKLDKETNKVSIDKVLIGNKSEKDNKNGISTSIDYITVVNLEDYKYVSFTFTTTKIPEEIESLKLFDGVISFIQVETKAFTFELENYTNNKEYYALFQIDDIYGNRTYSDLMKLK